MSCTILVLLLVAKGHCHPTDDTFVARHAREMESGLELFVVGGDKWETVFIEKKYKFKWFRG